MRALTVIHTNDLHNALTERHAQILREEKKRHAPNVLLLDAGDAVGSGNLTYRPDGEPILDRMGRAGYDAMAVGNREFHFTVTGFRCKIGLAPFPVLSANIRPLRDDAAVVCQPWIEKSTPNIGRVAIFGLSIPMIRRGMGVLPLSAYVFDDPIEVGVRITEELRPRCDLLICISHLGIKRDLELARRSPDLDLIVGGHSHTPMENGIVVGRTLIVQAAPYARRYGVVTFTTTQDGVVGEAVLREYGKA